MSDDPTPEAITDVLAHIERADHAVREQNLSVVVEALRAAVELYEQHPSHVHEETSQLRDLLVFIRSARSICQTLREPDDDPAALEDRAETLRPPLN